MGKVIPWLVAQMVKNLPAMQVTWVWSLGQEDPLEKGTPIQPRIRAWRIPWTEDTGGLESMGSQRVRHDWETNFFFNSLRCESKYKWRLADYFDSFQELEKYSAKQKYRTSRLFIYISIFTQKFWQSINLAHRMKWKSSTFLFRNPPNTIY